MPPRRPAAAGSKRVTRSQSKEANPPHRPPQSSTSQAVTRSPRTRRTPAPRRHAPASNTKDMEVVPMGSMPSGPSSSGPVSGLGSSSEEQSPNSATMVLLKDLLVLKSKALVAHLSDPKRNDNMWSQNARILHNEMEITKNRYLQRDAVFIDPAATGEKISEEKTEAVAGPVVAAAYTANLATLLYLCNQFKTSESADSNMVTEFLKPLDDNFPSSFIPIVAMDEDSASELATLAVSIRYHLALTKVGEGVDKGNNANSLRELITQTFFGAHDDDIDAYVEAGKLRSFEGVQPDEDYIKAEVQRLASKLNEVWHRDDEGPHGGDRYPEVKQELSEQKLPLLDQLEAWARKALGLAQVNGDAGLRQQKGRTIELDSDSDDSESSDDCDSNIQLAPHIRAAALRDGPPDSPSQGSQRDETPQDHQEITLSQIRASGMAASKGSQRLSNIQEESEAVISENEGEPRARAWRRKRPSTPADQEDDEEDAFQTDTRALRPKRQRVVDETPAGSVAGRRRPLPSTSSAAAAGLHSRKGRSGNQVAMRDRTVSGSAMDEDDGLDFSRIRNENNEERRAKVKRPNVQRRTPWSREDEQELLKAVAHHSAQWSTIARETKFEVDRDQQQVRDKARNMKVDFLIADLALPSGFDLVALGAKEKKKVISMGKNPDRKVDDYDKENERVTNNLYVGDD